MHLLHNIWQAGLCFLFWSYWMDVRSHLCVCDHTHAWSCLPPELLASGTHGMGESVRCYGNGGKLNWCLAAPSTRLICFNPPSLKLSSSRQVDIHYTEKSIEMLLLRNIHIVFLGKVSSFWPRESPKCICYSKLLTCHKRPKSPVSVMFGWTVSLIKNDQYLQFFCSVKLFLM